MYYFQASCLRGGMTQRSACLRGGKTQRSACSCSCDRVRASALLRLCVRFMCACAAFGLVCAVLHIPVAARTHVAVC